MTATPGPRQTGDMSDDTTVEPSELADLLALVETVFDRVDALAGDSGSAQENRAIQQGRALLAREQAREIFETLLATRNHLGLLSGDTHPITGEMWGNFPQTYSMVGIINGAVRLSAPWDSVI